jgi:hypothetical protein
MHPAIWLILFFIFYFTIVRLKYKKQVVKVIYTDIQFVENLKSTLLKIGSISKQTILQLSGSAQKAKTY